MPNPLSVAWHRASQYPKHLCRWKRFKVVVSLPLTILGLLFLILPWFASSNTFATIVQANQNPLGTCEFNLDFTPGNEKNAKVFLPYNFHNPSGSQINNLKFTFTLKTEYTLLNGSRTRAILLKGVTQDHALLPGKSLSESYSTTFAEAQTDFWRKTCDTFYLERDKYADYDLYLDIIIQFDILFEESDWIHIEDTFLNMSTSEETGLEASRSEVRSTSQVYKSSFNAAGLLIFVALFLTVTTLRKRDPNSNPKIDIEKETKVKKWLKNNKSKARSLVYSSLLTLYFTYLRVQAIEEANYELVEVLAPHSFEAYINALNVSTTILFISWVMSTVPLFFSKFFRADSIQNSLKSLSISILWLISAQYWTSAAVLSFDFGSVSVIRDRSLSMWPSYTFLGINMALRIIDLIMMIAFINTFKEQDKVKKRQDLKRDRKFLADEQKMKENIFNAIHQLNTPRATLRAITKHFENKNLPLTYESGEKLQESFMEWLITEEKLRKTPRQDKTIYLIKEADFEENEEEKDEKSTEKMNPTLAELVDNALDAVKQLNQSRASLNQIKHHFKKHSIPYKTKSGVSLDRTFLNRLVMNFELSQRNYQKMMATHIRFIN